MSIVIKTTTPFVVDSVLIDALKELNVEPIVVSQPQNRMSIGDIATNRRDYNGLQFFKKINNRWVLIHDQYEDNAMVVSNLVRKEYLPVSRFLNEVGKKYNSLYQIHLEVLAEQERKRLEDERKARVEKTRQKTIEKAKAQGYSVKETRRGSQIQLVLTRTV